jgi:hypothetical protein
MVKRILGAAASSIVANFMLSGPAVSADQPPDTVVATVNGEKILRLHVDTFRGSLPPEAKQLPFQTLIPIIINSMVETRLVAFDARRKGTHQTKAFKSRVARIKTSCFKVIT